MPAQSRTDRPNGSSDTALYKLGFAVLAFSMIPILAYKLAQGSLAAATWNPLGFYFQLMLGKIAWTTQAWVILVVLLTAIAAVAGAGFWLWAKSTPAGHRSEKAALRRIDHLAKTMANPATVQETSPLWLASEADKLATAIRSDHPGRLGLVQGITVRGNRVLRATWEYVIVAFAGTRMGKTAALAIPVACSAPGALIATSNKKDLFTHTAGVRRQYGDVWLFDLQGVATGDKHQRASFWFNPLAPVTDLPSASRVGSYFVSAAVDSKARVDSYFDGSARDLLGSYILAAALGGGDLRHVVEWLIDTQSPIPAQVLTAHGYAGLAETMRGKQAVNARQRDGFYDMARRFLAPLDEPRYAESILPPVRILITVTERGTITRGVGERVHNLPEFRVADFVRSSDAMYALSQEGHGSASAMAMALIGSILDEAERYGASQVDGRMPVPMVAVLDEAANVCKLEQLPGRYSHYGSRGIVAVTILQSPSQGSKVWGVEEFKIMCDSANVIWYGGNVKDSDFINDLSTQIGDHHVRHESHSASAGLFGAENASRQSSWQKERIIEPADLIALPKTRAIVTLPGTKPLLLRKQFWGETEWNEQIKQSQALYGDGAGPTGPGSGLHIEGLIQTAEVPPLTGEFYSGSREL